MGTQKTYEVVNGGTITTSPLDDSKLPGYFIDRIAETGHTIVILDTTFDGRETGSHYIIGVIDYSGNVVPTDGWEKMLRDDLVPKNVVDQIEKYFAVTVPESTTPLHL